jgi:hypothetical protein
MKTLQEKLDLVSKELEPRLRLQLFIGFIVNQKSFSGLIP